MFAREKSAAAEARIKITHRRRVRRGTRRVERWRRNRDEVTDEILRPPSAGSG